MTGQYDCTQTRDALYAYLRREVEGDDALALEQHLRDCALCWSAKKEIEKNILLLDAVPVPEPSPRVWLNIKRAIDAAAPETTAPTPPATAPLQWRKLLLPALLGMAAGILILLALFWYEETAAPRTARLVIIGGEATLLDEQGKPRALATDTLWRERQTVQCPAGVSAAITLQDGSTLVLEPQSSLEWKDHRRFFLRTGVLHARVNEDHHPLFVLTEHATTEVKGTDFWVVTASEEMVLTVFQGQVALYNDKGSVDVSVGQQAIASKHFAPTKPVKVDLSRVDRGAAAGATRFEMKLNPEFPIERPMVFAPGDPVNFTVSLTNKSPAILKLRAYSPFETVCFFINIRAENGESVTLPLQGLGITDSTVPDNIRVGGLVTMAYGAIYQLHFNAESVVGHWIADQLQRLGARATFSISVTYNSYNLGEADSWKGSMESSKIDITVGK